MKTIVLVDDYNKPVDLEDFSYLEKPILLSPHLGSNEVNFLLDTMDSNWIAPVGPTLKEFEGKTWPQL